MIPVKQTRYDEMGNCMEACIASLLHLKIEEVPKLFSYKTDGSWIIKLNNWLNKKGLVYIEMIVPEEQSEVFFKDKDFYYILIGQTRKNLNIHHAVIGRKGEIIHDPFPVKTKFIEEKNPTIGVIVLQCK